MATKQIGNALLEKALSGEPLSLDVANGLMDPEKVDLETLLRASEQVTRRHFGKKLELCAIYPAKVGRCSGDCAFCAQSVYHKSRIVPLSLDQLKIDQVLERAKELRRLGVKRYSLVTSGEQLTEAEFARILQVIGQLKKETDLELCASLGSLTMDRALSLKAAGVSRYHHNIETSRSFFPCICTTHAYEDKLKTLEIARGAGLGICCGVILSMGETAAQRVEMAFALKELAVDSVPINLLNPIPGTPLEGQALLSPEEILRTIGVFRLVLPETTLRLAGGREGALGHKEGFAYRAGINAMIVGGYLTTPGKAVLQELSNVQRAGLEIRA